MVEVLPKETDRETISLLVRRGAQLVEVLPREEYDRVHLAGAASLPLAMISRSTADRLKWDKPVIVYGRDCQDDLSARAAWRLSSLGFTQVYRYTAGKADWLANGLPVEGAEAQATRAADLADMDVPTCKRLEKVGEVKARIQKDGWNTCVVMNDQMAVLGLVQAGDLEKAPPTWTVEEAMERDPRAFRLNATLEEINAYLEWNKLDGVLVTTTDGKLFGFLKREDVVQALRSANG